MRICFLLPGPSSHPIGGYKVVYQYANLLARRGEEVTVVHAALHEGGIWGGWKDPREAIGALQAVIAPSRPRWFELSSSVRSIAIPYANGRTVPQADVVIATSVRTANLVNSVALERGIRGVYLIQGYEDWSAPADVVDSTWRLPLERVVIAPWLAEKGRQLGVAATVVQNAVEHDVFSEGPANDERPASVLALVSNQSNKRTDLVVTIFERLAAELPDTRLATFGTCARPRGLTSIADHYREPALTDLVGLYQQTRVYLCTSDLEGWHLPPAEAMACGCAVVSTRNGGVPAYAEGVAAFALAGDARSLGDQVVRLLNDPVACSALASLGQRRIRARTWDDATRDLLEVLRGHPVSNPDGNPRV